MFSLKDRKLAEEIVSKIKKEKVKLKFMHVCGTHQDTLVKHGLDSLLKSCGIEIGQGPGCPVCVTDQGYIDVVLQLADRDDVLKTCPECGEDSLKRLIGAGAGLIFKGSGFYINDYARKSGNGKNESESA